MAEQVDPATFARESEVSPLLQPFAGSAYASVPGVGPGPGGVGGPGFSEELCVGIEGFIKIP